VLRVARFAARFGFEVAAETVALMREVTASGELAELAHERVWQEIARGLMEPHPSRMLSVLRDSGALVRLLPEVDALFEPRRSKARSGHGAGAHLLRALDHAAARSFALTVRYAVLAGNLAAGEAEVDKLKAHRIAARNVLIAERVSRRLRAPVDCRDAARLAAVWMPAVHHARNLQPAKLLALFAAADGLRRPERLDALLEVCECDALSQLGAPAHYAPADLVREALARVKAVDAAAIAHSIPKTETGPSSDRADAIRKAVRAARLAALRAWRRERKGESAQTR
jgi:tRNA nucleotidyltransferase (CCA-adding enzyme)